MPKPPDHSHGVVQARGLTVIIDKDTHVPRYITGRNALGRFVSLHEWETTVPVGEMTLAGVARAYGFGSEDEFVEEVRRRGIVLA